MWIVSKGFDVNEEFVDMETEQSYGCYCPVCKQTYRTSSRRWSYNLYQHVCSRKHKRNEMKYNEKV